MGGETLDTRWIVCLLALVLTLTCHPFTADAQLTRGFVSGTVTDPTGSVLAGVEVTVTNTATNISRTITTNSLGFFRFAAVDPGQYSVNFQLTGFDALRIDQIKVNTAQEVTINQTLT